MAFIIEIEGMDGTGKNTQAHELANRLNYAGITAKVISFPRYENESSLFVRKYLAGDIVKNVDDINPWALVNMFLEDVYLSYLNEWKAYADEYDVLVIDRYVGSTMQYQGGKLFNDNDILHNTPKSFESLKTYFLDAPSLDGSNIVDMLRNTSMISCIAYDLLKLPKPDLVFYLSLRMDVSAKLRDARGNHDLHEDNTDYLNKIFMVASHLTRLYDWDIIECTDTSTEEPSILPIKTISDEIYNTVISKYSKKIGGCVINNIESATQQDEGVTTDLEIYFKDLTPEAQERYAKACGITDIDTEGPIDTCPIFIAQFS